MIKGIKLSNGHLLKWVVASGAFGFDGRGWLWERPLVWLGLIKPELFTVVIKTLTIQPRKGNLCWWKPWTWLPFSPWSCTRFIKGGAVNKVGLTNRGLDWWCDDIAQDLDFSQVPLIASIYGDEDELAEMSLRLDRYDFVGLEVNVSCPNSGDRMAETEAVIKSVKAVKSRSRHPVIVKVSVKQDYLAIAKGLVGVAEAISLNSVLWEMVFPRKRSPLWRLEKKVGGGGGGVSGKPAQSLNWEAVEALAVQGSLPVIAPSVMKFEDIGWVWSFGASAVSFGAIHLPTKWKPWTLFTNPLKPTRFVRKEASCRDYQK